MSQDKEREAFEAWLRSMPEGDQINLDPMPGANGRSYSTFATYRDREVETMWLAWQARAALASQQAVKGEPVGWRHKQYGHVQWRTPYIAPEVADRYTQNGQWVSFYASPPSREPQWQPIETAPKDGTDVLVMYMHIDTQVVHNAFYNHDDPDDDPAWWSYDKSEVSRVRLDGFMTPTHWMPLPPPPGIHSREGGSNDH